MYYLHFFPGESLFPSARTFLVIVSLSLVSGKSAFLQDGYIAATENCCAPTAVKRTSFPARSVIVVRRLVQHDICCALNVNVIRRIVQHEVVVTELYT